MANINKSKRPQVTTGVKGMQVADSPLNAVKLDLGLFILVGLVLFIFLESINISQGLRFLVLGVWALSMLVWVIIKTQVIIQKAASQENDAGQGNIVDSRKQEDNLNHEAVINSGTDTSTQAETRSAGESNGAK